MAEFTAAVENYDRFMGRYATGLAPKFADAAGVRAGMRVLDVGCGPGALAVELTGRVGENNIAAIDAMEAAFEAQYASVPTAIRDRSIAYGRAVGAGRAVPGGRRDGPPREDPLRCPRVLLVPPPVRRGGWHRAVGGQPWARIIANRSRPSCQRPASSSPLNSNPYVTVSGRTAPVAMLLTMLWAPLTSPRATRPLTSALSVIG